MLPGMAGPKEVEIKFALEDPGAVGRKLRALGFRCETPRTHEMNTLYDLPGEVLHLVAEFLHGRVHAGRHRVERLARLGGLRDNPAASGLRTFARSQPDLPFNCAFSLVR